MSGRPSDRLAELKKRFFDEWMASEPEEATTLGLPDPDGRLRDPSMAAADAWGERASRALADLDVLEGACAAKGEPFGRDETLDAWAIRAHATERVLAKDRRRPETDVFAVPYAIMMLMHAAVRATTEDARRTVVRRLDELPAYVDANQAALREGARAGRPFAAAVVGSICAQLDTAEPDLDAVVTAAFSANEGSSALPGARASAVRAGEAVRALARFMREEVQTSPGARDVVPIGEAEYQRRLDGWWRLGPVERIKKRATDELAHVRAQMIEIAGRLSPNPVHGFPGAKALLDAVMARTPSSPEEIIPLYERAIERSAAFCREKRLFDVPEIATCLVVQAPELWRRVAVCTNWPAPLLGGDAPGACAVVTDPSLHPLVGVPGLAVHEATPGHYLQSRAWQIRFGQAASPVRFLSVPDECGVLRDAWIPHFMIEGWAVFAEAMMEEAGFYSDEVRLFHFSCRAIHAARALADMALHTEDKSREEVASFLTDATGWPDWLGKKQAVRYAQSPLQANGYLIGHLAIEDVRRQVKERLGAAYDELAFQSDLLDAGPVPPALLLS